MEEIARLTEAMGEAPEKPRPFRSLKLVESTRRRADITCKRSQGEREVCDDPRLFACWAA